MSDKPFRPLLACETPDDLDKLKQHFPLYGSYKLDGIRAVVRNGILVSRTMKPIPSKFAQTFFAIPELEGVDGELLVMEQEGQTIYHDTYSAVMTHGSQVPVLFNVFDVVGDKPYNERLLDLMSRTGEHHPYVKLLEQRPLASVSQILEMEAEALDSGQEGLIVRRTDGRYKQGRSTLKEGILVKVARVKTSEAIVIGFEEMMRNMNPAEKNALGFTERSSHQENLVPSGMLGALYVQDIKTGQGFSIGTGFDHALRTEIWNNQDKYRGMIAKYKNKPYGTKDLPRQPSFLGWRDPMDMSLPNGP